MAVRAFENLGYLIKRVQHELRLEMDRSLAALGLTSPQYATLSAIQDQPGISNAELARVCFVTPQTMTRIIANLEDAGFIERNESETHGRLIDIRLTEKGRRVLVRAHANVSAIEKRMTSRIDTAELARLRLSLGRCLEALASGAPSRRQRSPSPKL